jgi:hypothetical protein
VAYVIYNSWFQSMQVSVLLNRDVLDSENIKVQLGVDEDLHIKLIGLDLSLD